MIEITAESDDHQPSLHLCPRCGRPLDRVHRSARDRLVSTFYPVWRFRCRAVGCEWQGLLRQTATASRSRTGSARSRAAWIVSGALLVALAGLAVAIYRSYDTDTMPVPTAPAKLVAKAPSKPDAPRRAAQDSMSEPRRGCVWEGPGKSPYLGTLANALTAAQLPNEVVRKIEIMRDGGLVTDHLEISSAGIRSTDRRRFFGHTTKAMAMGETVCFGTRISLPPDKTSAADLYELVDDTNRRFLVMIVANGGNVAVLEE